MTLKKGAKLGHYLILRQLGAGGMGEVYLAEDTKLDRRVALKILSARSVAGEDYLRRFAQEARAASRLNHPAIAHIYEIGESDDLHFIAMEYVEGESLSDKIAGRRLSVFEIADIGGQIADAIEEAHAQGIVHRDIKSQNVMLDRRGRVKVLDFGLAKISQKIDSEESTRVKTKSGVLMGTVSYMSPEQALGRDTDFRTDIWSLGVVLYEMATGRLPFQGESVTETIDRIAHSQPEAIARFNYDVPPDLEVIIKKALRKKREERYNSAKDLLVDLESLKRELEFGEHSVAPNLQSARREISASERAETLTFKQTTDEAAPVHTTSSAEYIFTEIKRHKNALLIAAAVLLSAAAGVAYWFSQNRGGQTTGGARLPFQNRKVTRVATSGNVDNVVISPDGKYIAYTTEENRKFGLWLKQTGIATSNVPVIPVGEHFIYGITFSPDSQFLYYVKAAHADGIAALYQMPALGGDSRKLKTSGAAPSVSPDGKRIAYIHWDQKLDEKSLYVAGSDGSGERKLATRAKPRDFSTESGTTAWSPDGKLIACLGSELVGGKLELSVVTFNAETGEEKRLTTQNFLAIGKIAWLADGSGLVTTAAETAKEFDAQPLWFVAYPSGEARRITSDLNNYQKVSLTKDSRTLAAIISENKSTIWLLPEGDSNRARQISSNPSNLDGSLGLSWTPDDKIVFHSRASGQDAVWIMNADGRDRKQLTDDTSANFGPMVSPDGRFIVFQSERSGVMALWRMEIDGSNQKQLTTHISVPGAFTPDGKWFVYENYDKTYPRIMKVPTEGGEAVQVNSEDDKVILRPTVSPDGKLVAAFYFPPAEYGQGRRLAFIPIEGGKPVKFLDVPQTSGTDLISPGFLWTPDRRALTFRDGTMNLWLLPLDGGKPKQLTNFNSDTTFLYYWSPDGKTLAVSRGSLTKDVVLISEAE